VFLDWDMASMCDRGGLVETTDVRNSVEKWVRFGEVSTHCLGWQIKDYVSLFCVSEWKVPHFLGRRSI
jgi:hypothetical protein